MPKQISFVNVGGNMLIIAPQTAKWLVLKNKEQLGFFKLLATNSVGYALDSFCGNISDAQYVIKQIEISKFETTDARSCISNGEKYLQFYLTNGCNLRCPHCYMFAGEKLDKELTTEEIKRALADYKSVGGNRVTFTGGEVTVRQDFLIILKYAHSIGLSIRVLTNGVLWSENLIKQAAPIIDSVQISIDGYSEKSNARIRGNNNFDKALKCIERFLCQSPTVTVEMSVTPFFDEKLKDEIPFYVKFLKESIKRFGTERFKINVAKQMIDGREVKMGAQKQKEYFELINQIYRQFYKQEISVLTFIDAFNKNVIMDNCMYGVYSIAANGDVFFCSRISSLVPIGNIKTMPFERIKELSEIAEQKSNIKNLRPCNQCNLIYICGGGCRVDYFPDLTETADIESLDMRDVRPRKCTEAEKLYYYNIMIKANELMAK